MKKYILLIIYVLGLVVFGFRPKIKAFYDGFLPSSDIGGWCMYQRFVSYDGVLTIQNGESIQELEWKKYINHGSFTSSPHPKLSKDVMRSFLNFLDQNHPIIRKIKHTLNNGDSFDLTFKITKIIEEQDSIVVQVSKKIRRK